MARESGEKVNVAVLGSIGVGKSTLISNLMEELKRRKISVQRNSEPSVSIPYVTSILEEFYKDIPGWAYPLQLAISSANEVQFQKLRQTDYGVLLFDAPYSSYIYCNIQAKYGRMTPDERDAIINVSRPFRFDYVIVLRETKEKTISHIKKRNRSIKDGKGDKSQSDKVISDFGYLDEHISDYYGLLDGYLSRFFPNAKVLQLEDLPRIGTKRYSELISSLADIIVSSQESIAQLDEVRQRLSIPKDGVIELVGEDFAVYCERDIDGREYHYMRNSEGDVSELSLEKTIVADIAATSSQDDLQNGKVVGNQISTDDFDICGTDANSGRYMYFKVVRAYMPAQA